MKFAYTFFLIFIILKQFYVFDSGTIQPADLFLLLSLIFYLIANKFQLAIQKIDKSLMYFLIGVVLINGFYFMFYQRTEFLFSILYYAFNFLTVITFRIYAQNELFLLKLLYIFKFNILVQFSVYILRLGRWYLGVRYMGTFNDPNQMAFFLFITLMLMFLTSKVTNKKTGVLYYLIVTFLIMQTASTGMLLAIVTFYLLNAINFIVKCNFKITVKKIIITSSLLVALLVTAFASSDVDYQGLINNNFLYQRLEDKIENIFNPIRSNNSNHRELSTIEERGIDKLLLYPEKLIFGAGQGYYSRFEKAAHNGEIHSTLPSILFYYGIFPLFLLIMWFVNNIKKMTSYNIVVFVPLLLESFTLLNQRQPFFWMTFVLSSVLLLNHNYSKTVNSKQPTLKAKK